jgi:prepilin-type N-terminal cleavage/methylation domain-containing protein
VHLQPPNGLINGRRAGFTLIELLVVVGIIGIILAFTVPAVIGISKSNNLNSAGRLVSNTLTIARSEAINRRALIRFEVATTWPSDAAYAYRKFTLVQHDAASGTDTQLTGWETLPTGTIFQPQDPDKNNTPPPAGKYFFALNQTQNVKVAGTDVPTSYIEFTPTGALNISVADSPARLRVDQGVYDGVNASVVLTGTSNWYDVSVDGLVGRIKLTRP